MKYSEAKKQIKALSSKYDVSMEDGDFNIVYNGHVGNIYVDGNHEYDMYVSDTNKFSCMPFNDKLYIILSKLARTPLNERVDDKKYYIKIFDNEFGYLNIDILTGNMMVYDARETEFVKAKFTDKEIEELKQRYDIPFDWNKVHFKEI